MSVSKLSAGLIASLCLFSSASSFANTQTLGGFDALSAALDAGENVRAVFHFDKCTQESGGGFPMVLSGGFNFDVFNHYMMATGTTTAKEVISTSKTVFSVSNIANMGAINNYIRLHVFKDNTARFLGVAMDPVSNEQKMSVSYLCPVSDDANQAGVMFFVKK